MRVVVHNPSPYSYSNVDFRCRVSKLEISTRKELVYEVYGKGRKGNASAKGLRSGAKRAIVEINRFADGPNVMWGAQAQSISWVTKGEKVDSGNWYLPVLASDYGTSFVVVGEGSTETEAHLKDQTAVYPDSVNPTTLTWAGTYTSDYTTGHAPSVALTTENLYPIYLDAAVEVHQGGQDGGAALWSHIAVTSISISATLTWTNGDQYDTGYNPKVAIDPFPSYGDYYNSSTVVEVNKAGSNTSDLWYHVGTLTELNNGEVYLTWGPSYQFDYGYVPSVSVCGGVAVEVHEGDSGSLWYSIGKVDGDQVSWSASVQYDSGRNPSVSMCGSPGYLVEVHQGGSPSAEKSTSL